MYTEPFIGGVVGSVGLENFSISSRSIVSTFSKQFPQMVLMPTTSIAIDHHGDVLEVVNVEIYPNAPHRYSVSVLNGRVIEVNSWMSNSGWHRLSIMFLTFLAEYGKPFEEVSAMIDFYETLDSSAEWDEIQEERQLLQEMIDDSDRYLSVPEAVYQRHAELSA
jgi:hypothetical protein